MEDIKELAQEIRYMLYNGPVSSKELDRIREILNMKSYDEYVINDPNKEIKLTLMNKTKVIFSHKKIKNGIELISKTTIKLNEDYCVDNTDGVMTLCIKTNAPIIDIYDPTLFPEIILFNPCLKGDYRALECLLSEYNVHCSVYFFKDYIENPIYPKSADLLKLIKTFIDFDSEEMLNRILFGYLSKNKPERWLISYIVHELNVDLSYKSTHTGKTPLEYYISKYGSEQPEIIKLLIPKNQ